MCRAIMLAIVLFSLLTHLALAEEKLPVPDDTAQKQAAGLIADLFKSDYDAAKTSEQKSDLAKKMLQVGIDSKDDSTGRYVLLRIARDISADAGDVKTALESVDGLSNHYDVDAMMMQADVLEQCVKAFRLPKEHQELAPILQDAIDDAISYDRFDIATEIAETAVESARQARSSDLVKQALAQAKEIKSLKSEFKDVLAAYETLKTSPTDPEANLIVGKYRCFVKSDWENGLPMLALGQDKSLKSLAEAELAENPDGLELGHGWWKYSEAVEDSESSAQSRATFWYKQVLPKLEGLSRKLVESRVGTDLTKESQSELPGLYVIKWQEAGKTGTTRYEFREDGTALKVGLSIGKWVQGDDGIFVLTYTDPVRGQVIISLENDNLQGKHRWQSGKESTWTGNKVGEAKSTSATKSYENIKIVSTWSYQPGSNPPFIIKFLSNGYVNKPEGPNTWTLEGRKLIIRWVNAKSGPPGGNVVTGMLSEDGTQFIGKTQSNVPVKAKLVSLGDFNKE